MDAFGSTTPTKMPPHFFWRAVRLDYGTAVRANIDNQKYGVAPRHWYIDAIVPCEACGQEFRFSAADQRRWYEMHSFWVDSFPRRCVPCRRTLRRTKELRKEYDRLVAEAIGGQDLKLKTKVVEVIDALDDGGIHLPESVGENRKLLLRQIVKARRAGDA